MSTVTDNNPITADTLSEEKIDFFRTNGFVHITGMLSQEEAARYREAAIRVANADLGLNSNSDLFKQLANVWRLDEVMKKLTLRPNVAAVAKKLLGVSLKVWHDQILIKKPGNSKPTEFHYDEAYHPHANSSHLISAWIALCDVSVDKGCMSFIPGSHKRTDLPPQPQNLRDPRSLFNGCPELEWEPRLTVPIKAGDCSFHHGRCAHMAGPNITDEPRVAHVVIFMDAETTFNGSDHVVTKALGLKKGDPLEGDLFPLV